MSEVKYQGKIDLTVENNSHTIAYRYIEKLANGQSLKVLEVGCSSGYFGAAVRDAGHVVWGIEPTEDAAEIAKEALDYVYHGLIEDFIATHQDEQFDIIVFGDVLEHMPDPQAVLIQCRQHLLTSRGAIVASVPNVAHAAVRGMLLAGNWEYADLGIMDRTHLRFFTQQSIQDLFMDAGYEVADIKPVSLPVEMTVAVSHMPVLNDELDAVSAFSKDASLEHFQYVLIAAPEDVDGGAAETYLAQLPKIKVLGLANVITSSHAEVRMIEPLKAWAKHTNNEVKFIDLQACEKSDIAWADIVVLQRHIDISTLNVLQLAREMGKKIVYETDDYLLELPEHLSHHAPGLASHREHINFVLPQVDCITATTPRLAQRYKRFDRPIQILPNCVVDEHIGFDPSDKWEANKATLIVASTDKILVDFILPAIQVIQDTKDLNVEVVVIGPPGEMFEQAGIVVKRVPNMDYDGFKLFLKTVEHPVGVIPLDDSLFSSCKTAIKYFDYSVAGIPVICSNVPPYSDVIVHGQHGLLTENTTEAWVENITSLVNDISLRKSLLSNAQTLIKARFSAKNVIAHYQSLFRNLMRGHLGSYPPANVVTRQMLYKNKFAYYRAHFLNLRSYAQIFKVLKREGVSGVSRRIRF